MNMLIVNASPRKNGNTAKLLKSAEEGAASVGANTEFFNLYDLNFHGCKSCFACKLKAGNSIGKCIVKDDLAPLLEKVCKADSIVIGSPIYLSNFTGAMQSFMERLIFPYIEYSKGLPSLFNKKIKTAIIATMNLSKENMEKYNYMHTIEFSRSYLERTFGHSELFISNDTLQFKDYSKLESSYFDADAKIKRNKEIFPLELEKAYELGKRLVTEI